MKEVVCQVYTDTTNGSGFFIDEDGLLVTALHNIRGDGDKSVDANKITVVYKGKEYRVVFPCWNHCKGHERFMSKLDFTLLKVADCIRTPCFPVLPDSVPIEEGVELYFAGFPLAQNVPTFHRGYVSSLSTESIKVKACTKHKIKHEVTHFIIDATVVVGNSGGPVVVQIPGMSKIYMAGMVTATLAPDLQSVDSLLSKITHLPGYPVELISSKDGSSKKVTRESLIYEMLSILKKNVSTGIGRALHIRHIVQIQKQLNEDTWHDIARFRHQHNIERWQPVGKGKGKPPGALATDPDYLDWYHRSIKGKPICGELLGRMISGGADEIIKEEEKKLRPHYLEYVASKERKRREMPTTDIRIKNIESKLKRIDSTIHSLKRKQIDSVPASLEAARKMIDSELPKGKTKTEYQERLRKLQVAFNREKLRLETQAH